MGLLSSIGKVVGIASGVSGLFGGDDEPSRAREGDSYALQAKAVQDNILPLRKAYEAAGFHPLLATGQQPFQPSGAVVGSGSSFSGKLASLGQSIERLGSVNQRGEDRALTRAAQKLQLENLQAQNDLLRAQATSIASPQVPPVGGNYAIPGQSGSGVVIVPREIVANSGPRELGRGPSSKLVNVGGSSVRVASNDLQQSIEDGPANWYWQGTRTIPDMILADLRTFARRAMRGYTGQ